MPSPSSSTSNAARLVKTCTGQRITVPRLMALFPAWKAQFMSDYEEIVDHTLQEYQSRWIRDEVALNRNHAIDPVFFSRSVFPGASTEALNTASLYISWLYFWDDALDFGEFDKQHCEMDRAEREIITSMEHSLLGLDTADVDSTPSCSAAQAWYPIGIRIRESITSEPLRRILFGYLQDYITSTIKLQKICDQAAILDLEAYLRIRMSTSAVYPTVLLYLLGSRANPPSWFFSLPIVKDILLQMNLIISICNDIVSVRAEIRSYHVDNIIPLLVHHKALTVQSAVNEAVTMMKQSYFVVRSLEAELHAVGQDEGISKEVEAFLQGCQNLCMGAIQWAYHIKRYFHSDTGTENGEISILI